MELPEDLGPVLGADEVHEPVPEPGAQLLPVVAAQLEKAGADAEEGEAGVGPALVHAAGDVLHQVLQLLAALLQTAADAVDPPAEVLLLPEGALPDVVLPPDLVPIGGGHMQVQQAHAPFPADTHQGEPAAQAGHVGPLHRPGAQPARHHAGVRREGDGIHFGFCNKEWARIFSQFRLQVGGGLRPAAPVEHPSAAHPGHLRVHEGQKALNIPPFQVQILKQPHKFQPFASELLHGIPPPGRGGCGPRFFSRKHYNRLCPCMEDSFC